MMYRRVIRRHFSYKDDEEKKLKYINKTTRNITNLVIEMLGTEETCERTNNVIQKFSTYLKKFSIIEMGDARAQFHLGNFLNILRIGSNTTFLELSMVDILRDKDGSQPSLPPKIMNEDLNFTNLNVLKIKCCSKELAAIFNRLKINSLTELVLHDQDLLELNELFKRQGTIKILSIKLWDNFGIYQESPPVVPENIFDTQKLKTLRFTMETFQKSNLDMILSKQKNLKRLEVESSIFGIGFLNVVTNKLMELETLRMHGSATGWTILRNIKSLKKLEYLQLDLESDPVVAELIEEFASFDHSNILILQIKLGDISRGALVSLAKCMPQLKVLYYDYVGNSDVLALFNMIMETFNCVECLTLKRYFGSSIEGRLTPCVNEKLIELNIIKDLHLTSIDQLIVYYPNLERLSIVITELTVSTLKALNGLKKLDSMSLTVSRPMSALIESAVLNYLRKGAKHLKFVEIIRTVPWKISEEMKESLMATYEIFRSCDGTMILGADNKLMRQREDNIEYINDLM